eukprot:COSAG06_NODE_20763_length_782_cov_1.245974_2_plen_32_part_01
MDAQRGLAVRATFLQQAAPHWTSEAATMDTVA